MQPSSHIHVPPSKPINTRWGSAMKVGVVLQMQNGPKAGQLLIVYRGDGPAVFFDPPTKSNPFPAGQNSSMSGYQYHQQTPVARHLPTGQVPFGRQTGMPSSGNAMTGPSSLQPQKMSTPAFFSTTRMPVVNHGTTSNVSHRPVFEQPEQGLIGDNPRFTASYSYPQLTPTITSLPPDTTGWNGRTCNSLAMPPPAPSRAAQPGLIGGNQGVSASRPYMSTVPTTTNQYPHISGRSHRASTSQAPVPFTQPSGSHLTPGGGLTATQLNWTLLDPPSLPSALPASKSRIISHNPTASTSQTMHAQASSTQPGIAVGISRLPASTTSLPRENGRASTLQGSVATARLSHPASDVTVGNFELPSPPSLAPLRKSLPGVMVSRSTPAVQAFVASISREATEALAQLNFPNQENGEQVDTNNTEVGIFSQFVYSDLLNNIDGETDEQDLTKLSTSFTLGLLGDLLPNALPNHSNISVNPIVGPSDVSAAIIYQPHTENWTATANPANATLASRKRKDILAPQEATEAGPSKKARA
ncbi:hypothetical protein M422DRAFT_784715 [Sphaerobolus stellatus SS14]|uniref:Uncharacterized protein n=1 Tax=Sphaerobolus stellatus (strain SS14) TaxID=990650 RepID=A0A0C9URV4_SPHS4|nr:hypothetical protein M422DRAFT_784715 [Sphaerobolus stellatus SS14]